MCNRRTIRKRLKRQKKKGGKLPVDLVKLAKIAISPVLGKGLAEFEVAFPFCFSFSNNLTIDNFPGSRAGAAWCETACLALPSIRLTGAHTTDPYQISI